jgi:hypothetical protein
MGSNDVQFWSNHAARSTPMKAMPRRNDIPGPMLIWPPPGAVIVTGAIADHEPSGFFRKALQGLLITVSCS